MHFKTLDSVLVLLILGLTCDVNMAPTFTTMTGTDGTSTSASTTTEEQTTSALATADLETIDFIAIDEPLGEETTETKDQSATISDLLNVVVWLLSKIIEDSGNAAPTTIMNIEPDICTLLLKTGYPCCDGSFLARRCPQYCPTTAVSKSTSTTTVQPMTSTSMTTDPLTTSISTTSGADETTHPSSLSAVVLSTEDDEPTTPAIETTSTISVLEQSLDNMCRLMLKYGITCTDQEFAESCKKFCDDDFEAAVGLEVAYTATTTVDVPTTTLLFDDVATISDIDISKTTITTATEDFVLADIPSIAGYDDTVTTNVYGNDEATSTNGYGATDDVTGATSTVGDAMTIGNTTVTLDPTEKDRDENYCGQLPATMCRYIYINVHITCQNERYAIHCASICGGVSDDLMCDWGMCQALMRFGVWCMNSGFRRHCDFYCRGAFAGLLHGSQN